MMSLHDTTHTDAPGCAVYRACLSISYLCVCVTVCVCINLSTYCIDYRISLEGGTDEQNDPSIASIFVILISSCHKKKSQKK